MTFPGQELPGRYIQPVDVHIATSYAKDWKQRFLVGRESKPKGSRAEDITPGGNDTAEKPPKYKANPVPSSTYSAHKSNFSVYRTPNRVRTTGKTAAERAHSRARSRNSSHPNLVDYHTDSASSDEGGNTSRNTHRGNGRGSRGNGTQRRPGTAPARRERDGSVGRWGNSGAAPPSDRSSRGDGDRGRTPKRPQTARLPLTRSLNNTTRAQSARTERIRAQSARPPGSARVVESLATTRQSFLAAETARDVRDSEGQLASTARPGPGPGAYFANYSYLQKKTPVAVFPTERRKALSTRAGKEDPKKLSDTGPILDKTRHKRSSAVIIPKAKRFEKKEVVPGPTSVPRLDLFQTKRAAAVVFPKTIRDTERKAKLDTRALGGSELSLQFKKRSSSGAAAVFGTARRSGDWAFTELHDMGQR